jgi:signal peptidase I
VALQRRKGQNVFTPLDDSILPEREIVRLSPRAFLTRPSSSLDSTRVLFSELTPTERTSYFLAPQAEPILVNWSGVGRPNRYRLRRTRKVLRILTSGSLLVLTGALALLIIAQLTGVVLLRNVATGSMRPHIRPGDVEVTVSPKFAPVHKGSVVIYELKSPTGQKIGPVGHRVIGGSAKRGWTLKGDANPYADPQHPTSKQLLGVVVLVIPKLGKYLTLNAVVYGLIALTAYWFLSDYFRRRKRVR